MEGVTIAAEDEDKIMHIGLPIGEGDLLMASDALESLGQRVVQGNNVYVSVHPTSRTRRIGSSKPCPRAPRSRCRSPTRRGVTTSEA